MKSYSLTEIANFMKSFADLREAHEICREYSAQIYSENDTLKYQAANCIDNFQNQLRAYERKVPMNVRQAMGEKFPSEINEIYSINAAIEEHKKREQEKHFPKRLAL